MNDYIKREDAIRTMAKYMMDMALIDNPEASDRIEQWEGSIAAPVMSTVKAADVVEVVRCKYCKYRHKEWHKDKRNKNGGYWIVGCGNDEIAERVYGLAQDNDFCSFGERVEE